MDVRLLFKVVPALIVLGIALTRVPVWAYQGIRKQVKEQMSAKGIVDDDWIKYIWIKPSITIGWLLFVLLLLSVVPAAASSLIITLIPERADLAEQAREFGLQAFVASVALFIGFVLYFGYKRK